MVSYPDISSIPKLAEILEVSMDDLMQIKAQTKENISKNKVNEIVNTALKGIGVASISIYLLKIKQGENENQV